MARKNQVKSGQVWTAKVSNRIVHVRIIGERLSFPHGTPKGWLAVNLETGREITIKSAARLRALISAE